MAIQSNFPAIRPTLDLNFSGSRTVDPRIAFSRAGSLDVAAYYNANGELKFAKPNEPRVLFDPSTLECKGLLSEELRTNLLLNSAILATQSVTVTATAHTLSFFGTGTVTLSGAATGTLTGTSSAARSVLVFTPTAGTLTVTVSGSCTLGQLEVGDFASSYIPTTSAQVTRSADTASMTGTNLTSWFRQDEGTIFVEGAIIDGGTGGRGILRFDDGTELNRLMIRRNGASRIEARFITNDVSVAVFDTVNTAMTVGQNIKAAFSYKANDFAFSMNGIPALTDTSGGLPTFTRFLIGDASGTGASLRACTIKRIAFYPKALPAYLQAMTA